MLSNCWRSRPIDAEVSRLHSRMPERAEPTEVVLNGVLGEFRTALREELEAARRASSSGAIQLLSGRRIGTAAGMFQYLFQIESVLNLPDDSPGDLRIAGQAPVETTVLSVEGLSITLSVPIDLGEFIGRAALQSDLTHLLRRLIERIEDLKDAENPAGGRLLGNTPFAGEPAELDPDARAKLNAEQFAAVASALGRNTTFIWGPPGTGKTMTIGRIGAELVRRDRSLLLVSHTNAAVDQAVLRIADELGDQLKDGSVLRLGETKDARLATRPRLLVQTHIDELSATLREERQELHEETAQHNARREALRALLAVWAWLPKVGSSLPGWKARLDELAATEAAIGSLRVALSQLKDAIKAVEPQAQEARETLAAEARCDEIPQLLDSGAVEIESQQEEIRTRKEELRKQEGLLALARVHRVELEEARVRLPPLEAQRDGEREMSERALADLQTVSAQAAKEQKLLEDTRAASGIRRRLRGLPDPDQQAAVAAQASRQFSLKQSAASEHEAASRRLSAEIAEAEQTIARWENLPLVSHQEAEAEAAGQLVHAAEQRLLALAETRASLGKELQELGTPVVTFQSRFNQDPTSCIQSHDSLVQHRDQNTLPQLRSAEQQLSEMITWLLDDISPAYAQLLQSNLGVSQRTSSPREMVEELEARVPAAIERVAGSTVEGIRAEEATVLARVRAIETRLREIDDELQQVEELVVARATVVATTLTRAYKRDSVRKRTFDTVVLDEASMAPIPALWAAAALATDNVVLVGDPKQLPPIKHSDHPLAEKWLGRDVFEASNVDETQPHCVQLQEQFRMHPAISEIPNHFVYEGALRDGPDVLDDAPLDDWYEFAWGHDSPVLLVDTGPLDAWVTSVKYAGRTSRLNFLSAATSVGVAELLLRPNRPAAEGGSARILIGAPYRPQAKLVNLMIRHAGLDAEVRSGTAHTFQGSEAPVMIFDLVNDEPHWKVGMFIPSNDPDFIRLLNVALTRAQRRLILVGDFDYIVKTAKNAFIRRLIDHLRATHPVVNAADVIPTGLAVRAARASFTREAGGAVEAERLVVLQDRFYEHLHRDLADARTRVVFYSPFVTQDRVASLEPHLKAATERGVAISVVTKPLGERKGDAGVYRQMEAALASWGCQVVHKKGMHEKLVFVDDAILWSGSLNPLSFSNTQEVMERRASSEVVSDYASILRLNELIGAYVLREAGPGTCPFCEEEIIAAEGGDDPFYWRCVNDRCFTRSIGAPMPRDGMVVCQSPGCGAAVEFGQWGDDHVWRCAVNVRHRTRIGRSHLRLPKMRALIPKRELVKLDKTFGTGTSQQPTKANSYEPAKKHSGQLELMGE